MAVTTISATQLGDEGSLAETVKTIDTTVPFLDRPIHERIDLVNGLLFQSGQ